LSHTLNELDLLYADYNIEEDFELGILMKIISNKLGKKVKID
jgi:hypothetical protein